MPRYCTNCKKNIGTFESTLTYNRDSFIFCSDCFPKFQASIFALKKAETLEETLQQFKIHKPIMLNNGMSKEALISVKEYFGIPDKDLQDEQLELKKKMDSHLLTTGYNFEGYQIKKYYGIVSSHIVMGTGFLSELSANISDFLGESNSSFAAKMDRAKLEAMGALIKKSVNKGGNALIGVDFDYTIFHNNMIGLSANGTSVLIEKADKEIDTHQKS